MIYNLIFNFKNIQLICFEKFENFEKNAQNRQIKKTLRKLKGFVITERSILVKNQSQVFPSHIMGFRYKK